MEKTETSQSLKFIKELQKTMNVNPETEEDLDDIVHDTEFSEDKLSPEKREKVLRMMHQMSRAASDSAEPEPIEAEIVKDEPRY